MNTGNNFKERFVPVLIAGLCLMLAGRVTAQTFTTLHNFTATFSFAPPIPLTNSDGAGPVSLILSGDTLYGMSAGGGSWGNGTAFAVNIDGSGFTNLHSFSYGDGVSP